jgi:hypothetical protein
LKKGTQQLANVTVAIDADKEFSDADRRNGLEYAGRVSFKWVSFRHIGEIGSKPSNWQDNSDSFGAILTDLHLEKYKNGEWKVSPSTLSLGFSFDDKIYKKPECSQIPQALLK